jgi:hypothetical protein
MPKFTENNFYSYLSGIFLILLFLVQSGCATIFGWSIHAPGILSPSFHEKITPTNQRIALHIPDSLINYQSKNRGGRFADPQTYHIGESFTPMLLESFQYGFQEFILMETSPTPEVMQRYGIPHLVVVGIRDFGNRVTLKGQAVELETMILVYNSNLEYVAAFEAHGTSDAQKVFAKKGGPEVNLNAAIENNLAGTVQFLQDFIQKQGQV